MAPKTRAKAKAKLEKSVTKSKHLLASKNTKVCGSTPINPHFIGAFFSVPNACQKRPQPRYQSPQLRSNGDVADRENTRYVIETLLEVGSFHSRDQKTSRRLLTSNRNAGEDVLQNTWYTRNHTDKLINLVVFRKLLPLQYSLQGRSYRPRIQMINCSFPIRLEKFQIPKMTSAAHRYNFSN